MDTPHLNLEEIKEAESEDMNEDSFRVTKMNQNIIYYQQKLHQLRFDRDRKWQEVLEMCPQNLAEDCYNYFMDTFNRCSDSMLRDEDLQDITDYMISKGAPNIDDLQVELFWIWHLEGEIKIASNELGELMGWVPF